MATKPKAMSGTGVLTTVSTPLCKQNQIPQVIINSYENRQKSYNRLELDAALITSLTILLPLQKQTKTTTIYKILIKWSSMNQTGLRRWGPPRQVFPLTSSLDGRINLKKEKSPSAGIILDEFPSLLIFLISKTDLCILHMDIINKEMIS